MENGDSSSNKASHRDISNCYERAWRYFVQGKARYIRLRLTDHRFSCRHVHRWYWRWTLTPLGVTLQWVTILFNAIAWYLRFGKVYHTQWSRDGRTWYEFTPRHPEFYDKKWSAFFILFDGIERESQDKQYDQVK